MLVRSDAVSVVVLSEIHRTVLVAEYRVRDFLGLAGECRERARLDVLVLHRNQGHGKTHHAADPGSPDARAVHHRVGIKTAT